MSRKRDKRDISLKGDVRWPEDAGRDKMLGRDKGVTMPFDNPHSDPRRDDQPTWLDAFLDAQERLHSAVEAHLRATLWLGITTGALSATCVWVGIGWAQGVGR